MSTNPTPFEIDIPNFGKVPVQANQNPDRDTPTDITHRTLSGRSDNSDYDPRLQFRDPRITQVNDPRDPVPHYAVRKQKIVILTPLQFEDLKKGKLIVGTTVDKKIIRQRLDSLNQESINRIIGSDCPDVGPNGEPQHTVLLDWTENTDSFPDLLLQYPGENATEPIQTNNYLVVSGKDGPNDPPARPPANVTAPLNSNQSSDFRPVTQDDDDYYRQHNSQDSRPVVAVMDTGLKFNLESDEWPHPYMYRDADGQERRFTIAYQEETSDTCNDVLSGGHLGYCALLSYRAPGLIQFSGSNVPENDVIKSPFDDYRLFEIPGDTDIVSDARHGTFVTAIIQQNGNDAPVLPIKAFDNVGFATLFDVLNGFNYILHRAKSTNIRVVNASWICWHDYPLLRNKIEQLLQKGIFVVAAAGNEGQAIGRELDEVTNPVYPACYSEKYPNVITVTSVRKTYFRPNVLAPKQDSVIGKVLNYGIKLGLFPFLEGADDVIESVLPPAGYVAVENYSTKYVNVGVVSTFGYFRSPFWKSPIIRGSSFACGFVSGYIVRQLLMRPALLTMINSGNMTDARKELLKSMHGDNPDVNLGNEYVKGGHYLNGYAVD